MMRAARAEIDLHAVRHNVGVLREVVAPAEVWAVVKANAYGHGAVDVARAALDAGADGLCVALVQEGVELRRAGIESPVLVLSEQSSGSIDDLVAARLTPTAYNEAHIDALAAAVSAAGLSDYNVHLKLDTGMRRVGAEPAAVGGVLACFEGHSPTLRLGGVFTHLACADEPGARANDEQLDRFDDVLDELRVRLGPGADDVLVHAANSAAAIAIPRARRSVVRCGIAIYGISPGPGLAGTAAAVVGRLRPAMRLVASVSHLKRVEAGTHISYGWRYRTDRDTVLATVPIGYADGVPRRLGGVDGRPGAEVLIGGRRCPIVGVVTMDQLVVDVGPAGAEVAIGDEVVLIGTQGDAVIRAEDWADLADTIGYEIVCGISARVPRRVTPVGDQP